MPGVCDFIAFILPIKYAGFQTYVSFCPLNISQGRRARVVCQSQKGVIINLQADLRLYDWSVIMHWSVTTS